MTTNPGYHLDNPLHGGEAREAAHRLSEIRRRAEAELEAAIEKAGATEAAYRKTLARAFVTVDGATAAQREAAARSVASDAAYDRDLAAGMVKVCQERLRGLEGDRAMLRVLIEWSRSQEERAMPAERAAA